MATSSSPRTTVPSCSTGRSWCRPATCSTSPCRPTTCTWRPTTPASCGARACWSAPTAGPTSSGGAGASTASPPPSCRADVVGAGDELAGRPAVERARLLAVGEVSAREVLADRLRRIEAVNPALNAVVTLTAERAESDAAAADRARAGGRLLGPLHGLPVAHKDLFVTAGIRTTLGSPLFADWVPDHDALIVARERAAGAVTVGKTNTPEFGAGSQTFNPVFGATHNPWDTARTCGGSSGGAATALAAGMVALADGSDMGGSLRN